MERLACLRITLLTISSREAQNLDIFYFLFDIHREVCCSSNPIEKAKPAARRGRKATGLSKHGDSRVAWEGAVRVFIWSDDLELLPGLTQDNLDAKKRELYGVNL